MLLLWILLTVRKVQERTLQNISAWSLLLKRKDFLVKREFSFPFYCTSPPLFCFGSTFVVVECMWRWKKLGYGYQWKKLSWWHRFFLQTFSRIGHRHSLVTYLSEICSRVREKWVEEIGSCVWRKPFLVDQICPSNLEQKLAIAILWLHIHLEPNR